jgi:hypothetical protein
VLNRWDRREGLPFNDLIGQPFPIVGSPLLLVEQPDTVVQQIDPMFETIADVSVGRLGGGVQVFGPERSELLNLIGNVANVLGEASKLRHVRV